MPLLLLPLLVVVLLLLWVLLWPVALWQRYRAGRARRRAVGWVVGVNAWLLLVSAVVFVASAWLMGHWIEAAPGYAAGGLLTGMLVGWVHLALTRFEREPRGFSATAVYYTPNRWVVLGVVLIVAARLAVGVVRAWQMWQVDAQMDWLARQGSLLAVGGLVLGHYLAYAWGLRRRLRAS